ncbi:TonB-dependent receptor [Segatella copri]|uniref:TonB-dependent receptor n=1 Tax=Segatella copri TaxID=165179 RepID=UPI00222F0BE1|nr:TonB-dependent receptor [Segatella copri]MCW4125657.1 TonB-dependent receptor [Segatella copri]
MNLKRISASCFCLLLAGQMTLSAQNVSFSSNKVTLKSAFEKIEKESKYKIAYNSSQLDANRSVTLTKKSDDVFGMLNQLLKGTNFTYEMEGNYIVIKPQQKAKSQTHGKKIKVRGVVKDETGEPVIGATVMEKGTTNNGVVTDLDGNYTIEIPADGMLAVSYIGCKDQDIKVNGREVINVNLADDNKVLSEVVVVGYGTQKKANLTGAVSMITADDINNRPVSSAAGALQGADPSVNLTFNSGSLDSGYSIDIRGVASINGGNPLVLADGMEVSLNQINPNDIESVSVLKDASASAIYGAKASSGVILITTKSGKDSGGKATITYNGRVGWKQNTTSTDFIHTGYDHVSIVNQFYKAYQGRLMLNYTDDDLQMLYDRRNDKTENPERPWTIVGDDGKYYYYGNFDWYDYFYRKTRPEQEHNVSVNGGNDKVNYFASARFFDQDGIFNIYKDNYQNVSFRAKMNAKLSNRLSYSVNFNFNKTAYKYAGYYNEQQTIHSLQSNTISSFVPRNPDGTIVQYTNQLTSNSPLGAGHAGFLTANEARNSRENKYWIVANQLDYKVFDDLVLTASYAYKNRTYLYKRRSMPFEYSRAEGVTSTFTSNTIKDFYQEGHMQVDDNNLNVYATYSHLWDKKHNLKVVAGGQYEDYRTTDLSVKKNDLLSKDLSSFTVAQGETTVDQEISAWRTLGYFARVNYDYEGKYLAEVSGRWDGTSKFASKDRWGFFPSASLGWRFSQEKFWEKLLPVVNNAKLRFSIGSLGNQQVSNYAYFDRIYTDKQMSYTFDGLNKAYYASVSDPLSSSLTWETVSTYNWGLDLSLLDSRLTLTADVYIRDTKNMLTHSITLPSVFGAVTPKKNCADLRTNGWELYIGWQDKFNLAGKPFHYNVSATIGDYKSKITKFNNPDKLISDYYEGMTLGEIWGYKVAGLFASDEAAAAYQAKIDDKAVNGRVYSSKKDNHLMAGDVEFIDLDGDNVISEGSGTVADPGDKRIIGNTLPRYSYSFRLGADWNGIDFSAFFQGVGKRNWYPTSYAYDFWGPYSFPSLSFIHKDFMDNVWSEENPGGYFPRARGYASYSGGALGVVNDRYLQNAAYLRLKNLTVGYTIPVSKTIINSLRVYFTAENLFYWSPLKKYSKTVDPEMIYASSYNSGSGVGYSYSKSFSFGLDIKF